MGRSGKLIAVNDLYIRDLCLDPDYKILNDGRIYTLIQTTGQRSVKEFWRELTVNIRQKTYKGRLAKPRASVKYKRKDLILSRVVFQAFVGDLEQDLVINHKDGNTLNNTPENLELVTQSDNNKHMFKDLNRPATIGHSKINYEIAEEIRADHKSGLTYSKLIKKYGLAKSTISYIITRRTWNTP